MTGTVAVTGADGFIGTSLCATLENRGHRVARIVRRTQGCGGDRRVVPDLADASCLEAVLSGADAVVHLAGRAHVLRETEARPEAAYQRVNVDATVRLAEAAARAGVRRFVFVSSIGVNGNQTYEAPFTESDAPAPVEPYAMSKLKAEQALRSVGQESGLEVVVVRPPIVYGPGVKGNFLKLLRLVESGVPLPVASLTNRRSLVGVANLAELLALCVERPAAAGELLLAADPEVHSTPALIEAIAKAMRRGSRLFRFPPRGLRFAARLAGVEAQFCKTCGSLEVCSERARRVLGWSPSLSFDEGISTTIAWYRKRANDAA
jgi:UDP-N-acetyl-alpha-D-quinovosamine dehydrogenase